MQLRRKKQTKKWTKFAGKTRFSRNRCILQETEQESSLHIPTSFARLFRHRVLYGNCLYNASFYQQAPGDEQALKILMYTH